MMVAKTSSGQKRFQPHQYLKWTQIASFFSRTKMESEKTAQTAARDTSIDHSINSVIENVMSNFDEIAEQVQSDTHWNRMANDIGDFQAEDAACLDDPAQVLSTALRNTDCFRDDE